MEEIKAKIEKLYREAKGKADNRTLRSEVRWQAFGEMKVCVELQVFMQNMTVK